MRNILFLSLILILFLGCSGTSHKQPEAHKKEKAVLSLPPQKEPVIASIATLSEKDKEVIDEVNKVFKELIGKPNEQYKITFEGADVVLFDGEKTLIVKKLHHHYIVYKGPAGRRMDWFPGTSPTRYEKHGYMSFDSFLEKYLGIHSTMAIEKACKAASKGEGFHQVILDLETAGGGSALLGAKISDYRLYNENKISHDEWGERLFAY